MRRGTMFAAVLHLRLCSRGTQQEFIKSMTGAETANLLFQYPSLLTPV
jgi:hypothetical protein